MKLIIGLGNSGDKYKNNRHNVGFVVVDNLVQELGIRNYELRKKFQSLVTNHQSLIFAKPQTMMNNSGQAVKKMVIQYKVKIPDLWVIHDDLDLQLGSYKIQKGKGPREHKGLLSIEKELGTKDFWHVRVGIENRNNELGIMNNGNRRTSGEEYVLQDFTEKELEILGKTINNVVDELLTNLS